MRAQPAAASVPAWAEMAGKRVVYGRDRLLPRDAVAHSTMSAVVMYRQASSHIGDLKTTTGNRTG
eukprot:2860682-Prymnesium_polylepis.1